MPTTDPDDLIAAKIRQAIETIESCGVDGQAAHVTMPTDDPTLFYACSVYPWRFCPDWGSESGFVVVPRKRPPLFENEVLFTVPKKSPLFKAFKRFMTWRPSNANLFDTREPRQGGPGDTAKERTTEGGTATTMNGSTTGQPHEADR